MTRRLTLAITQILLLTVSLQKTTFAQNTFNRDSLLSYLPLKFSGQIVIKKHSHFIYKESFGNKNFNIPTDYFNDSTLFNIGEIEHSLIYHFIGHLEKLGQIKRSDPVNKYIKSFPYSNIQINHLLHHQSGLPSNYIKLYHKNWYSDLSVKLADKAIRFTNDDLLYILEKKQPKLNFYPGEKIDYSDLNYLLLTSVIEQLTFTKYPNFVQLIFKHHELDFIPIVSPNHDTIPNKAYGFRYFPTGEITTFENLNTVGFNYSDGTTGNQHTYLSTVNLALWGQYAIQQLDLNKLKENAATSTRLGGFTYNKKYNCIQIAGSFGGTYSQLIYFPQSAILAILNSNLYTGQKTNKLLRYLSNLKT